MFKLTRLRAVHAEEMARLEQQCFSLPWSLALIKAELCNPLAVYLGAFDGAGLTAYAGMQEIAGEGHITNIATAPEYRRRGLGSALLSALTAYARADALGHLELELRRSNTAALALYLSHGFELVGERPGYYERPREDALLMTLWLKRR